MSVRLLCFYFYFMCLKVHEYRSMITILKIIWNMDFWNASFLHISSWKVEWKSLQFINSDLAILLYAWACYFTCPFVCNILSWNLRKWRAWVHILRRPTSFIVTTSFLKKCYFIFLYLTYNIILVSGAENSD